MSINLSNSTELKDICSIHENAFEKEEQNSIVKLVTEFITEPSDHSFLSFVSSDNSLENGHVLFSEVKFNKYIEKAYILAPLAVLPSQQKKGIGASLVNHGLKYLENLKVQFVFVYGDPNYYSRFGFKVEKSYLFVPPYELQFPHGWQNLSFNNSPLPSSPIEFSCAPPLQKSELW